MSWFFGDKTKKLTGPYAHGQKYFRCSFTKEEVDTGKVMVGDKITSGDYYWRIMIEKKEQENSEKQHMEVSLMCKLESWIEKDANQNWKVEADYTIRLLNPVDSDKNVILHGTHAFRENNMFALATVKSEKITDEFWEEDSISFEAEIGVKSIDLTHKCTKFGKKTSDTDVALVVDGIKYYVTKKTLSDASSVFKTLFDGLGDAEESKKIETTVPIDDTNPNSFRMLLDLIHGNTVHIEGEFVEEFLKLGDRFKVTGVKEECAKFLKTSVVDDAEAVRLADKYQMEDVIKHKLESLNTLFELKSTFRAYRYFSDNTMRLLIKKLITVNS